LDLCTRVDLRKMTKRVLEHLVKAGAMDCLGTTRAALLAGLDRVHAQAQKQQKERDSGQLSMMGLLPEQPRKLPGLGINCEEQTLEEMEDERILRFEKDALGLYLSSHPLLAHRSEIRRLRLATLEECAEMGAEAEVKVACIITSKQEKYTKKGDKMAICWIEDLTSSCEMLVFPRAFEQMRHLLDEDQPLLVTAKIAPSEDDGDVDEEAPKKAKLFAESAKPLSEAQASSSEPVTLALDVVGLPPERLDGLCDVLASHPGHAPVYLCLRVDGAVCRLELDSKYKVYPSSDFHKAVEAWRKELCANGDVTCRTG
jgi:DNA polymerase-3 subunit alpha